MADEPRMPGTFARTMTVILERIAAGEPEAEVLTDYTWEHGAPPDLTPFRDCRAQLEAVTRERDEMLKILNGPEVVGLRAQLEEMTKELSVHINAGNSVSADLEVASARVAKLEAALADARTALRLAQWASAPEQHQGTSAYPFEEIGLALARMADAAKP